RIAGRRRDGDAGRQREPGDRVDHAGGAGEGAAIRYPRRRTNRGSGNGSGDYCLRDFEIFMRDIITMQCTDCKERNYSTTKNKKKTTERLEMKKFCPRCRHHTIHRETK